MIVPSLTIDKAIQLKPDFAEAYYNRGSAYGDKETTTAPSLTTTKPSNSSRTRLMPTSIADLLTANKATMTSHRGLRQSHPTQAGLCRGLLLSRDTYSIKGEYDRAIADFDQAIQLKPDYA